MMVSVVFQVDWFFVDIVIIILLFLLLLGVKIFKSTHRWRPRFSNKALNYYSFPKSSNNENTQHISIKKCNLTRNSSRTKQNDTKPLILILRTKFKKQLTKTLTEGLSSYGFNVINLKLKKKQDQGSNTLNKPIKNEVKFLISLIINYFKHEDLIANSNYVLLNLSKPYFPNVEIQKDPEMIGLLLINPRMNKYNIGSLKEILHIQSQITRIFYIFSKRNFFIFKNSNLKHFCMEFGKNFKSKEELITLDKSTNSFRYYETILLSIIIDIIENKLLKTINTLDS
ncbi:MAG: hypothetical protein ACFFFT_11330 [Candidatus Thorarchaeota archaeon]